MWCIMYGEAVRQVLLKDCCSVQKLLLFIIWGQEDELDSLSNERRRYVDAIRFDSFFEREPNETSKKYVYVLEMNNE